MCLDGSPYPDDFDENEIYYHGGIIIAIEAGLLTKEQIKTSLNKMVPNVKASGAGFIGLTFYLTYPDLAFENKGMYPYGYQNGGDWPWFGGRMIQQLVKNGFTIEAYEQLVLMTERVMENKGFTNGIPLITSPDGSGTFKGLAGVLSMTILELNKWAEENK